MPKIAIEIVIEAQLIAHSTHSTTDTESERQTKRERESKYVCNGKADDDKRLAQRDPIHGNNNNSSRISVKIQFTKTSVTLSCVCVYATTSTTTTTTSQAKPSNVEQLLLVVVVKRVSL